MKYRNIVSIACCWVRLTVEMSRPIPNAVERNSRSRRKEGGGSLGTAGRTRGRPPCNEEDLHETDDGERERLPRMYSAGVIGVTRSAQGPDLALPDDRHAGEHHGHEHHDEGDDPGGT